MHITIQTATLLTFLTTHVAADCCPPLNKPWLNPPFICGDGTDPTPCCGYGECNIFCCNCDDGCRGPSSAASGDSHNQYPLLHDALDPGSYDSTFDAVSGEGFGTIALSDYLVWATTYDPRSVDNATALEGWIGYFHRFDANGDGKIDFGEMHRPAGSAGEGKREL